MNKRVDVAVSYGFNRVAYNIVRALSANGLKVAVGDSSCMAMAKSSRYCKAAFKYRSFYKQPEMFIQDLEAAFLLLQPKVYLPSHEETFVVAKYYHRLVKTGVKVPVADFNDLRILHRKDLLAIEAQKLSIPTPITFKVEGKDQLDHIWQEAGKNGCVVIKLLNTNSAKGVFYAHSYKQMVEICGQLTQGWTLLKENYPLIQEYVEGAGYGVSMLFNHGVLKAKFTHKRLREKLITGGTSTVRISTENPEIENYAQKLLTSMKWHGVAMVEFKYNEYSKQGWLIEVNPRFWGSLALAIHSGVNFPLLLYKMALNGDVDAVAGYKKGIITRWILGDVLAALDGVKNKKKLFNIMEYTGKGVMFDDFHLDDPLPFLAQCGYYGLKFLKEFKMNPTTEAVLDIDHV